MDHQYLGGHRPHTLRRPPTIRPEESTGDWQPGEIVVDGTDLSRLWQTLTSPGRLPSRRADAAERRPEPIRRTLWLAFLDAENRVQPTVFPIDNIPDEPGAMFLSALGDIVDSLVRDGLAASLPVLLERPGPPGMTEADRRWARAARHRLGPAACRWPVHLATSGGIRPFAPDDLLVGTDLPA